MTGEVHIVNKYKYTGPGVFIGRGSVFGNPYPITRKFTRDMACRQYEPYFDEHMQNTESGIYQKMMDLVAQLQAGQDVTLVCFCKPKRCHGDTIKRWLEELAEEPSGS